MKNIAYVEQLFIYLHDALSFPNTKKNNNEETFCYNMSMPGTSLDTNDVVFF
jgi:hypothetical protein